MQQSEPATDTNLQIEAAALARWGLARQQGTVAWPADPMRRWVAGHCHRCLLQDTRTGMFGFWWMVGMTMKKQGGSNDQDDWGNHCLLLAVLLSIPGSSGGGLLAVTLQGAVQLQAQPKVPEQGFRLRHSPSELQLNCP
eukprot:1151078-Pelagomonas_calceolata.AAC.2